MGKWSKTRQIAEGDHDDADATILERRLPAGVGRRWMTALMRQTAGRILDSSDAKFTNNSLSKAVVSELGTPKRDRQFLRSSTNFDG